MYSTGYVVPSTVIQSGIPMVANTLADLKMYKNPVREISCFLRPTNQTAPSTTKVKKKCNQQNNWKVPIDSWNSDTWKENPQLILQIKSHFSPQLILSLFWRIISSWIVGQGTFEKRD